MNVLFPLIVFAPDGWIEIFYNYDSLKSWNISALNGYIKMGVYFLDYNCNVYTIKNYILLNNDNRSKFLDFFRYIITGIPQISEVSIEFEIVKNDDLNFFIKKIVDSPPNKNVVFTDKVIAKIVECNSIDKFISIIKKAGV
jgi:hypothetical protein